MGLFPNNQHAVVKTAVGTEESHLMTRRIRGVKGSLFHDNKNFHFASKDRMWLWDFNKMGRSLHPLDSQRGERSQGQGRIIAWRYGVAASSGRASQQLQGFERDTNSNTNDACWLVGADNPNALLGTWHTLLSILCILTLRWLKLSIPANSTLRCLDSNDSFHPVDKLGSGNLLPKGLLLRS